jgi:hypothetical protein
MRQMLAVLGVGPNPSPNPSRKRIVLSLVLLNLTLFSGRLPTPPDRTGYAQNGPAQIGRGVDQTKLLSGVVKVKNGILIFTTIETYEENFPFIANMSAEQSESWEKSLGLVSQRNIFNQIVKAEYEYLAGPYEDKSPDELKRIAAPKGHTVIYNKYLQQGLIRIQRDASGEETYVPAVLIASYLPIINEQGYFIVGDTIYQIKNNLIKEMRGVDFSKLSLLDKATSDDSVSKIKVQPAIDDSAASTRSPAPPGVAPSSGCSYPRSSGWVTIGGRRAMTTVTFSKSYWNPFPYAKVTITYNVSVQSQKKNFWGSWVYPSCPNECWIGFTWTTVFDYISKISLGYAGTSTYTRSYSYPHPNCLNYFSVSLNPTTGTTAPYPSSFIFTAPGGLAFLDARFQNADWHVSCPGGSSGINCSVSCP